MTCKVPTLLDLPAGARARGRAHGEAFREVVGAHLNTWIAHLDGGRASDPRAYLAGFIEDTDFLPSVRRFAPDLIEEVEGIAEGAGQPLPHIWALQMLDEEWAYSQRRVATAKQRDKCSAFGIAGNGADRPTLVGQNMDLGAYTDGFQVILRLAADPGGTEALVFSLAGMIGLMGVNAARVGVHVNTLAQLPSAPSGLPVAFVMRSALQRHDARTAAAFVAGAQHASGQHYLLADPNTVLSLESCANGSVRFAGQIEGRIVHTNHSLAVPNGKEVQVSNSVSRLQCLERRLGGEPVPDVDVAKAALSSFDDPANPVCRLKKEGSGFIGFTTGSMVSTLKAEAPVVTEITFGPPSNNQYQRFEMGA